GGPVSPSPWRREAELAATARRRKDLAGVRQTGRVERVLDAPHRGEVSRRELQRHVAVLLHADAVLAGERTARLDARREDLDAGLLRALELIGSVAQVEHDQRMNVPVPGMEDIGDPDAVPLSGLLDETEDLGKAGPRDDPVLHVVVRGETAHRRERALP